MEGDREEVTAQPVPARTGFQTGVSVQSPCFFHCIKWSMNLVYNLGFCTTLPPFFLKEKKTRLIGRFFFLNGTLRNYHVIGYLYIVRL